MKTRAVALCCVLALIAAACGSRLSNDQLAQGGGSGTGQSVTAGASSGPPKGVTEGTGGPKVGTLPVPCGPAPKGQAPSVGGQEGVTPTTIKLAVISDKSGVIKVPTASVEESMVAFTMFCNSFGGINGHKIQLVKIDSKLFSQLEATQEACNDKVFAIVGSGSVTDNQGAQAMVDCGLIEVPAYTATTAKAMSDNLVQPVPNPSDKFNVGPALFVKKKFPRAIKKAAILWGDVDVAKVQAQRIVEAYQKVGFKFVLKEQTGLLPENYTAQAQEMKRKGVRYVTDVDTVSNTVKLIRDMKLQNFTPDIVDLGQQFYDPSLPATSGSEGTIVQLNTVPFEEASSSPALQAYLAAYKKVGSPIQPTTLGVQSFDAGLLFATAAKAAGSDLTRDRVLAELKKIKKWDGGGLTFQTDPGDNQVNDCFLYMIVKNGKFVPYEPSKPATFDCDPSYRIALQGNYGSGAKRKGS